MLVKGVIMLLALHYWMEMYITAQGPRLRNDLYCVEWDVKLYYTIPYLNSFPGAKVPRNFRSRERRFPLRTFAPGSEKSWYQMRNVACGMIPYFTRCIYSAHSAIRDRLTRSIEPRMFVGSIVTDVRYGFTTFVCLVGIKHCYRLLSTGSSQLRKI